MSSALSRLSAAMPAIRFRRPWPAGGVRCRSARPRSCHRPPPLPHSRQLSSAFSCSNTRSHALTLVVARTSSGASDRPAWRILTPARLHSIEGLCAHTLLASQQTHNTLRFLICGYESKRVYLQVMLPRAPAARTRSSCVSRSKFLTGSSDYPPTCSQLLEDVEGVRSALSSGDPDLIDRQSFRPQCESCIRTLLAVLTSTTPARYPIILRLSLTPGVLLSGARRCRPRTLSSSMTSVPPSLVWFASGTRRCPPPAASLERYPLAGCCYPAPTLLS